MTTPSPAEIVKGLSEAQQATLAVFRPPQDYPSAQVVALRLGYRPSRIGILPATAKLRSLERLGLIGRLPPEDQWCVAKWFIRGARQVLREIRARRAYRPRKRTA